jgi:HK97 family phage major capsid protein
MYLGDVVNAYVDEDRGNALVKLTRNPAGEQLLTDWLDGIHTKTSVGYMITDAKETGRRDGVPVFECKWRAMEISSVPIPADDTVGFGRAEELKNESEDIFKMDNESKQAEQTKAPDLDVVREGAVRGEQKRIAEIIDLGEHHGEQKAANEYMRMGKSVEQFKEYLLKSISEKQEKARQEVPATIGMGRNEQRRYSLVRAINAAMTGNWGEAGLELEASRAVEKQFSRQAKGFFVPMDMMQMKRDVDWYTEKTDTVKTILATESFIDMLYKRLVVRELGCTILDGIVGNVDIPRLSGGATVYWANNSGSENTAVTESTPTFDKITLTPKSMGAIVDVSKLLLNQSSLSVENILLNDMTRAMAIALDTVALSGTGSGGQPTGVLVESITTKNASNGASVVFGDLVNMETEVAVENADMGSLAYVTNTLVRGLFKQTVKSSSTVNQFLWEEGNKINGYKAVATNVIPEIANTSSIVFGNWADLILAFFAPGLDITVDPYTGAKSRLVSLICYQDVDVGIRHLKSFCKAVNITT